MKHFFTLLFFTQVVCSWSQANINTRSYLIIYDKQINADSLAQVFHQNRTPADERSRITLQQLHAISQASGSEIEHFLEKKVAEKSISGLSYTKFWLINAVWVNAPASFMDEFNDFSHIQSIEDVTNLKAYPIVPTRMEEDVLRAVGAAEPGLLAVGVRFLWDLGYTGKGLKLMSFDTGIWPTHPALGGRFYGEYMPLNLAWNGIISPVPADKSSSHGTHTIGTMSGLDTLTHDTLGLAFKAYSMATDPIVSNLADTIGMQNIMNAYQWVLNPDGDINTTDDMPAVICNSWGTAANAGFCGSFVSDMLEVIDLTGVANEYSAGNDGPGASTTGVPALVNPGIVNSFAVGAIDGNSSTFPIASFSSRGPSPCPSTGSLQIKPEVVAPGVNVRSCVKLDSYAFYDGTSMAGPHAAGLMLLLKEAFPSVAGETLKEALYYSATDLGVQGEDNTYGMGLINAEAAYNWLIGEGYMPISPVSSLPEFVLEKKPLGLLQLACESPYPLQFNVYNEGNVPINDTVYFSVNLNGNTVGQWAQQINLAPQQRVSINAPVYILPVLGNNEVWLSAKQKNTPVEKDMVNNNRTWRFTHYEEETVPYTQRFEVDTIENENWTIVNPDMARTFELRATEGQDVGVQSAAMRFILYSPAANQKDYLISPPIRLNSSGNHKVAFDISYHKKTSNQKDTLSLLASLDCGANFDQEIFVGTVTEMATHIATNVTNFTPSAPEDWKRLTFDLPTAWNGQTVLFAFESINNRGGNAYLDDFSVFQGYDELELSENELPVIAVYPNPFTNEISVKLHSAAKTNLTLYDLSGRIIATTSATTDLINWQLDENLSPGTYLLKVSSAERQQIFKLLKVN